MAITSTDYENIQQEERTTDELIKGYWDSVRSCHVEGLWERVTKIEKSVQYLPHAFWALILLQISLFIAKNADPELVAQLLGQLAKAL